MFRRGLDRDQAALLIQMAGLVSDLALKNTLNILVKLYKFARHSWGYGQDGPQM